MILEASRVSRIDLIRLRERDIDNYLLAKSDMHICLHKTSETEGDYKVPCDLVPLLRFRVSELTDN